MKYAVAAYAIVVGTVLAYIAYLRVERQKLAGERGAGLRPALRAPASAAAFIVATAALAGLLTTLQPDQPFAAGDLLVASAGGGVAAAALAWVMRGGTPA